MKLFGRLAVVLATGGVTAAGMVVAAGPASAYDYQPCERTQVERAGHWVQYCPLWRDNVPVFPSPSLGNNQMPVGYLDYGGWANWFVGDVKRSTFYLDSYANDWWAYTLADNGQWGWVPEVYFSGGDNYDPDSGLYPCQGGPEVNDCPPDPNYPALDPNPPTSEPSVAEEDAFPPEEQCPEPPFGSMGGMIAIDPNSPCLPQSVIDEYRRIEEENAAIWGGP